MDVWREGWMEGGRDGGMDGGKWGWLERGPCLDERTHSEGVVRDVCVCVWVDGGRDAWMCGGRDGCMEVVMSVGR